MRRRTSNRTNGPIWAGASILVVIAVVVAVIAIEP